MQTRVSSLGGVAGAWYIYGKLTPMGLIYATVELINLAESEMARRHIIDRDEIKRIYVSMLVDSGCAYLCINEVIQEQLQLPVIATRWARLANDEPREFDVVGPIELRFEDRFAQGTALVLPGNSEPLLGAIALEELDVIIHPLRQEMVVHPDHPPGGMFSMKAFRNGVGVQDFLPVR